MSLLGCYRCHLSIVNHYIFYILILFTFFNRTEFDYKQVCSQLITTHYVLTNKIIHVYFSHMTYLMSHVTSLNNTREWSYKLSHSGL